MTLKSLAYGLQYPAIQHYTKNYVPKIEVLHILPITNTDPHVTVRLIAHEGVLFYAYVLIHNFEVKGTSSNFFIDKHPTPILSLLNNHHLNVLTYKHRVGTNYKDKVEEWNDENFEIILPEPLDWTSHRLLPGVSISTFIQ